MQVGYFTERPYRWLPEEEILKNGGFFGVSATGIAAWNWKLVSSVEVKMVIDWPSALSPCFST